MRNASSIILQSSIHLLLISFTFLLFVSSTSQQDTLPAAMEEREKETLYSVIQSFVGDWWNGSDLYPDPCGWTPIQVPLIY